VFDPEANGLIGGSKDPESGTPAYGRLPVLARGLQRCCQSRPKATALHSAPSQAL